MSGCLLYVEPKKNKTVYIQIYNRYIEFKQKSLSSNVEFPSLCLMICRHAKKDKRLNSYSVSDHELGISQVMGPNILQSLATYLLQRELSSFIPDERMYTASVRLWTIGLDLD